MHATIEMSNPREPNTKPIKARGIANTDTLLLCIPEHLAIQLKLYQESEGKFTVANGRSIKVSNIRPVKVTFGDRLCFLGALVLGDDVLMGAVPIEDMALTINPSCQRLEPDPHSPNIPMLW